jgi:hypothetical protein
MKRIIIVYLLVCIFIPFTGISQKFTWNVPLEVKDSKYNHYIGSNQGAHFLLTSKFLIKGDYRGSVSSGIQIEKKNPIQILKFDDKLNLLFAKSIVFGQPLYTLIDAFIAKDKILINYWGFINKNGKGGIGIFVDVFNLNGEFIETKEKFRYNYNLPINQLLVEERGSDLYFFNFNYEEVGKYSIPSKIIDFIETVDGKFIALLKNSSLIVIDFKQKKAETIPLNYGKDVVASFKLKLARDYLIIASLYGRIENESLISLGTIIKKINLITNKDEKTIVTPFSKETYEKFYTKKQLEKGINIEAGLCCKVFKDIQLLEDGSIISIIEDYWERTSTSSSGTHSMIANYGEIILIKLNPDGSNFQRVHKRISSDIGVYDYLLSSASFYEKNNLYILYNQGTSPFILHAVKFDLDLNVVSDTSINTYKDYGLYFGVRDFVKVEPNKYFVLGRWQSKIGSFFVEF